MWMSDCVGIPWSATKHRRSMFSLVCPWQWWHVCWSPSLSTPKLKSISSVSKWNLYCVIISTRSSAQQCWKRVVRSCGHSRWVEGKFLTKSTVLRRSCAACWHILSWCFSMMMVGGMKGLLPRRHSAWLTTCETDVTPLVGYLLSVGVDVVVVKRLVGLPLPSVSMAMGSCAVEDRRL